MDFWGLWRLVWAVDPGEVLELIVIRDGEEKKLEIVTKERPNTPQAL